MSLRSLARRARTSDFVSHGLLVFAALMFANVLQFVFYSLISRSVGVEPYGAFSSLLSALLLIAVAPATVGATLVARLSADLHAVADTGRLRRMGDVVTGATAIIGLVACGAVALLAQPIAEYLHLASTTPVLFTGVALGLAFAVPVQRGVFAGMQQFGVFAMSNVIEAVGKVAAGPLLAAHYGIDGALLGLCIASALSFGYNAVQLRRTGSGAERLRLPLRRLFVTSTNVTLAVLAVNALLFYDVILVRHFFAPALAGLYGASALVGRALYTVVSFLPTVVLPKASARSSSGLGTRALLAAALGIGGVIVGICLVATAVAPRLIVTILAGYHFADADVLEFPYTFALGALALANVVAMYKIGLHRFDFVGPLTIVAVAEIATVSIWHSSIHTVLAFICAGHVLALAAAFWKVNVAALYADAVGMGRTYLSRATRAKP